jgi:NO-binding membrane sensor protein with MHYT domain
VASAQRTTTNDFAGGVLLGLGVAAMHYTGMSAFVTQGHLVWEHATVGLSAILGVSGATTALVVAGSARTIKRQAIGGGLGALAIVRPAFRRHVGAMVVIVPIRRRRSPTTTAVDRHPDGWR